MRYLGLDLGTKTLGLALGIESIATPYKVLRYEKLDELIKQLLEIIEEEKIDELVLGLPKNMNNSLGFASQRSLDFKDLLEKYTDKKIHLIDERLSTKEAENILISTDTSRKSRKKVIDSYAASIILETFLNMNRR